MNIYNHNNYMKYNFHHLKYSHENIEASKLKK